MGASPLFNRSLWQAIGFPGLIVFFFALLLLLFLWWFVIRQRTRLYYWLLFVLTGLQLVLSWILWQGPVRSLPLLLLSVFSGAVLLAVEWPISPMYQLLKNRDRLWQGIVTAAVSLLLTLSLVFVAKTANYTAMLVKGPQVETGSAFEVHGTWQDFYPSVRIFIVFTTPSGGVTGWFNEGENTGVERDHCYQITYYVPPFFSIEELWGAFGTPGVYVTRVQESQDCEQH